MQACSLDWKRKGHRIGFIPTMGFLHEGHIALVRRARKECDAVTVSIFVNPTQFGPTEDFEHYPRDFKRDAALLESEGADALFFPEAEEVYPKPYRTYVDVEDITDVLCGASRPGHFRGVATIVLKLINIVGPQKIYLGEKDAQQLAVIKQMVSDLDVPVEVIGCATEREADGLAMSSRNSYLNADERVSARVLSEALFLAESLMNSGMKRVSDLKAEVLKLIERDKLIKMEYICFVDPLSLEEVEVVEGATLLAVAARIGRTRLIDNITLRPNTF